MSTKLWQNKDPYSSEEEKYKISKMVERFTIGQDKVFDVQLAEFDVLGSLAHAEMLSSIGIITNEEWKQIKTELELLLGDIRNGQFEIEAGVEDVHSQVEFILTKRLGATGKKIHTGRSRGKEVLTDIKLFLRSEIQNISLKVKDLFDELVKQSEKHTQVLMPGYTHFQIAMPSSFGLWFAAYAESLSDDLEVLAGAYKVCNKNPLGSGAGYGSPFPLKREMTTELLGFESMNYNVVYAQMTRGKTEKIVAAATANIAATLSKFSYDICLYMGQNFGFISFPEVFTTGSSIMPHKKNPDIFELIRGKCNRLQALPNELTLLTNNLPSGYHRDMQLTKEILFPGLQTLKDCIDMMIFALPNIVVQTNVIDDKKYDHMFSVEELNREVVKGVPFRDAYLSIAGRIADGSYAPRKKIEHTISGGIGNLCLNEMEERFDKLLEEILSGRKAQGNL